MSTWLCKASGCSFLKMNMISINACLLHFSTNLYKVREGGWEEFQGMLSKCTNIFSQSTLDWTLKTRAMSLQRHWVLTWIFCSICTVLLISYGLWKFINIVALDTANTCQEKQKPNMKQWDQSCICFLVADKMSSSSHLSVWSADTNLWNFWWDSWSLISVIFHLHCAGIFLY